MSVHKNYVRSLYKRSLNTALDWYPNRLHWRPIALQIRAQFEASRGESSPVRIQQLVRETEDVLDEYQHPLPYKYTTAPGGTKYERNKWFDDKTDIRGW
ncbi:hypothetical protein GGI23_006243 [Coemansia sp. RSA 2559]|nr:hypothetical protein GGI23_006243 [Coemansia sp. RSA 2559]